MAEDASGVRGRDGAPSLRRSLVRAYTASRFVAEAGRQLSQPASAANLLVQAITTPDQPVAVGETTPEVSPAERRRRALQRFGRAKNAVIAGVRMQHVQETEADVEEADEEDDDTPPLQALRVAAFCLIDLLIQDCISSIKTYPLRMLTTIVNVYHAGGPGSFSTLPNFIAVTVVSTLGFGGVFWGGLIPFAAGNALSAVAAHTPAIAYKAVTGRVLPPVSGLVVRRVCQLAVVWPQLHLDAAFERAVIIDTFGAVLAAAGPGSEVSGRPELPQLLLRLPRDRDEAAMVACVVLHRLSWATELCGLELLRRLLPSWHPLHEGRGFAASLAATPLYLPRLCMFPLYALPQPHLEWKGLFARPAGGWRWFFYIHTLQTAVNMAVGKD